MPLGAVFSNLFASPIVSPGVATLDLANAASDRHTGTEETDTQATLSHTLIAGSNRVVCLLAAMEKPQTSGISFTYNGQTAPQVPDTSQNNGINRVEIATYTVPSGLSAGSYTAEYTTTVVGNLGLFVCAATNVSSVSSGPRANGNTSELLLNFSGFSVGANDIAVIVSSSNDSTSTATYTGATQVEQLLDMSGNCSISWAYAVGVTGIVEVDLNTTERFCLSSIILRSAA